MSLHQLLQDCGADDDDVGSELDVCIENDPPAAGAAGAAEVSRGTDDLPAGGTSSLSPQEDEAQGGGDEAQGAMDGTLDPSPNSQSPDDSGGDGARPTPLREAAGQQAGNTPRTPERAGGGSAGPAPPETSGRTPTASRPAYSGEALRVRLGIIPLEGKTVDDVAAAVVEAYQEFGVEMRRCDSKKSKGEAGGRLVVVGLACKHAMPNRQKEYRQADTANGAKKRKSSSQRTKCAMKVYVRWPVRGERSDHPYLTFGSLEHDHPVDKGIVDEVRRQTRPLDTPTKDACGKLTDAGFKPAVQGRMIEALTGERPNTRAIQNHAAAHGRWRTPYDANELLQRVKEATADGGKYLLKMVALVHSGASRDDQVRPPTVEVGDTWQAIPENATIETTLQRVAQTGQSNQDRRLLYVEMLKKATAAVSSGVQLVPPETMRAIVQTFESSMNAAAMISSGQGAVLGNPQAVRQPAARSEGTREKSSVEYGGAKNRRRAQANHT